MSASAPPDLPGFTFVEPIGEGGFADVYLYQQRLPSRRVAVKVLKQGADGARLEMFHAEANVMAQLSSHPSIMPIHQADVSAEGHPYLVMEFCPGPHLAQRFRRERMGVAEVLEIGVKISSAVETAHRAGILHRDIKPHNILTNVYGAPLLTDFGIASAVGEVSGGEHGMSIPWSAPEVLAESPSADVRSDIFSLAGTVYSLLAGRSPFEVPGAANDGATLINRIERHQPSRILRPDVPDSLNDVLLRAMAKRPADRYQSAMAFAHALQEVEIELRRTPTRLEVLDAGPTEAGVADNDDRTLIKPVSVIVPDQFHPTVRPRQVSTEMPSQGAGQGSSEVHSETIMQRRFQPAPAGMVDHGPSLAMAASASGVRVAEPEAGQPDDTSGRNPWVIALISLVVVALAVYGVISLVRGESERPAPERDTLPVVPEELSLPAPAPLVTAARTPNGFRFSWVNEAPVDGDQYKVVRTRDGVALPELRLAATSVPVKVGPGQSVCVVVTVLRKNLTQQAEPSEPVCVAS